MATRRPASASSSAPPMSPPPAMTTSKFFVIFYAAPLVCGSESRIAHGELANSCERTSAFFAAARARVQSPIFAASRASAMKLRTFDARSCWVAFSDLPSAEPMLCSATLKLWLVCCWAATASGAQQRSNLGYIGLAACVVLRRIVRWHAGPWWCAARDYQSRRRRRNIQRYILERIAFAVGLRQGDGR